MFATLCQNEFQYWNDNNGELLPYYNGDGEKSTLQIEWMAQLHKEHSIRQGANLPEADSENMATPAGNEAGTVTTYWGRADRPCRIPTETTTAIQPMARRAPHGQLLL